MKRKVIGKTEHVELEGENGLKITFNERDGSTKENGNVTKGEKHIAGFHIGKGSFNVHSHGDVSKEELTEALTEITKLI